MNTKTWSSDDRDEFHAACRQAWESDSTTRGRTHAFREIVRDAIQAHRPWAYRVEDEALNSGMGSVLKRWGKQHNRVMVSYSGEVVAKPKTIGTVRTDEAGNRVHQQVLFTSMTWDELVAKKVEYLRQIKSYGQNVGLIDKLLALHDLAPHAKTPEDAARSLGTTVDSWLSQAAA